MTDYYGVTIVGSQMYPSQTRRIAEPLQRLAGMVDAQAVLALDFGSAPPYLVQAYRKAGFKLPLYQTQAQVGDDYLDLAGDTAEGVRMPVPLLTVAGDLPDSDPSRRILRAYVDAYKSKWDVVPNFYGAYAHDALLLVVSAIARAGNVDRAAVRDARRCGRYISFERAESPGARSRILSHGRDSGRNLGLDRVTPGRDTRVAVV